MLMATIFESENVILVDTFEGISSIDVSAGGSCGNQLSEVSSVFNYIDISKENSKTFKSYATADNNGKRIKSSSIKVYGRSNGEFPNLNLNELNVIKDQIQTQYNALAGGIEPAPLSSRLASEIAGRIGFYYNSSDIKLRVEKGAAEEMDKTVWNDKAFSPIMEKFFNLRFPIKEYYIQGKKESYTPTFNATIAPGIRSFSDITSKYNIKIKLTNGEELNFCKSALISVNRNISFGMRYKDLTSTSILPDTSYANWGNKMQDLYNTHELNLANQIYNYVLNPGIINSIIEASIPQESYIRLEPSSNKYGWFSARARYTLGNSFADNWEQLLLPDGIGVSGPTIAEIRAALGNLFQTFLQPTATSNQSAAETVRQQNRNTLGTPSVTDTTNLQLNTQNPVVTPQPVDPGVTGGTGNSQGGGTYQQGGGAMNEQAL